MRNFSQVICTLGLALGPVAGTSVAFASPCTDQTPPLQAAIDRAVQVKVKPNASISILEAPLEGNIWRARLKSPPVDGKANQELVALVPKYFGCAKARVSIRSGAAGRMKRMHIEGILKSDFLVQTFLPLHLANNAVLTSLLSNTLLCGQLLPRLPASGITRL